MSGRYCAAVVNSTTGTCRQCEECAHWSDAIDSVCPSSCASANVGSNSSTTAEELYNAYGYWSRVRDEGRDVIAVGCLKSAEEATRVTSGALKGRKGGCAPVFTKKAVSRWCQFDELTLRYPFNSCIATASNDYCGVGEKRGARRVPRARYVERVGIGLRVRSRIRRRGRQPLQIRMHRLGRL